MPRNIIMAAALPATSETLFDMYLDAAEHAAFTGMPVTLEPHAGGVFRAFDGRLSGTSLRAQVSVPGFAACSDSRRECLAVRVCTRKPAKIAAFANADAGDEKGHFGRTRIATRGRRNALSVVVLLGQQARSQH